MTEAANEESGRRIALDSQGLTFRLDGPSPACKVQELWVEFERMCSSGIVIRGQEMRCEGPKDFLS